MVGWLVQKLLPFSLTDCTKGNSSDNYYGNDNNSAVSFVKFVNNCLTRVLVVMEVVVPWKCTPYQSGAKDMQRIAIYGSHSHCQTPIQIPHGKVASKANRMVDRGRRKAEESGNWSSGKYSGVCCIIPWQLTNVRTSVSRPLKPRLEYPYSSYPATHLFHLPIP